MSRHPPKTDEDLLDLVEASLFEVPLSEDEISDLEQTLGVNLNRLVTRVKASMEGKRDQARRAAFAETGRRMAQQREEAVRRLTGRPWLTASAARARISELKQELGSAAAVEGYKLDKLHDDEHDLNAIVGELELLLAKSQK